MLPQHLTSSCGNHCTHKYSALTQIPWRVFCKKGCNLDEETWEECLEECNHVCYKDPVLKDQKWSAYIDRSPGSATYSEYGVKPEEVDKACPSRTSNQKPGPQPAQPTNPSAARHGSSA